MSKDRSYFAIIPASVRYDDDLKANAKLLYGEITALCNQEGFCWASNQYFADLYGVSKETVSRWISQLEKKQFIEVHIEYKEGTKEVHRRLLTIKPIDKKIMGGIDQNVNHPIDQNVKDNNTEENSTFSTEVEGNLFPEFDPNAETTFQKSPVYDKKLFFSQLSNEGEMGIDLNAYYHALDDWSEGLRARDKRKKKTARGWIAQARSFIRLDHKDGKVMMMNGADVTERMRKFLSRK